MGSFLHTSDWQLGITRHFLDEGVGERYAHDRFERIRRMGEIARDEGCLFVVVCGDVFEANEVGRKTILRSLSAMSEIPVPVYLLPGNHDPLNETSVYRNRIFVENKPANVIVLENGNPVSAAEGMELVAAPWRAKRLAENPLHPLLRDLKPAEGMVRVIAAHGEVDALSPMSASATRLSFDAMRAALADGRAQYFALGDKHSLTRVDSEGRIWYSGTPEATAFREPDPGYVNVVSLSPEKAGVKSVRVGTWTFKEIEEESLTRDADVAGLLQTLSAIPEKERCVLRLRLAGLLGLSGTVTLREKLAGLRDLFASFECDMERLHTGVEVHDIEAGGFTGFAAATAMLLKEKAGTGGDAAAAARDALMLLAMLNKTAE